MELYKKLVKDPFFFRHRDVYESLSKVNLFRLRGKSTLKIAISVSDSFVAKKCIIIWRKFSKC